ncbi:MAG: bifunctional diaminohydroxyphosphoribosylaminopyrimidine deaminase/5-amino-6-(5-phosphoribosylamino)uracil reductase RibD [Chitinispirillales bacterium]|jgi:diaminohydroxyphosphoribosylaminopyrimidine deaminase/5-amino-6-(5-phosphoribosylamino)uracil reductase|nr:bifunctional diaminohydroxyphosphoribosylaminopyrimidine deaminase/5-amino-6-(5-phosphoribosylamino)uracil reductase RibD [Chitinispirillales bacterium]
MTFSESDKNFMLRALELARAAKGRTFPNPAVGAVVVTAEGKAAGEGATGVYGGPHAEKNALKKAGAAARGGTLYVTLEPCSHFGRTPPCTDEIIKAGIKKVVTAVKDPNPLVGGKGMRQLKSHGIIVESGLLKNEAVIINEDFFWSITQKRPWITLKLAMTLDGRVADDQNASRWITSAQSRRFVQELRRCHSAIAVGKNTLLHDNPRLTARCGKTYFPARIVFSSDTDIPQDSYFFTNSHETRSIVVLRDSGNVKRISSKDNLEFWYTASLNYSESINAFLDMAYAESITSIFIEGGQRLASSFLEHGFVNKVHLFYGNKIFGKGKESLLFSRGLPVSNCLNLEKINHRSLGEDFLVSGYVKQLMYK